MKLKENFASVYAHLLPDLVELEVPDERWADCANCHVCSNKRSKQFHTKCCDYHPFLPNYVVGLILSDDSDELKKGREILEQKIKNKTGLTPFGIFPPVAYQQKFIKSRIHQEITTQKETTDLRCPYYLDGDCSIYKYRTDVCGTSFCISVSLSSGKRFWKAAKELNQYLDKQLALRVAKAMGFDSQEVPKTLQEALSAVELEGKIDTSQKFSSWKEWTGNEIEYFKKCHERFKTLTQEDVEEKLGQPLQTMKQKVESQYAGFISNELPQLLKFDEEKWANSPEKIEANSIDVWLLRLFDGRNKTDDIMKKALNLNVGLSNTLRDLVKKKIIVEV